MYLQIHNAFQRPVVNQARSLCTLKCIHLFLFITLILFSGCGMNAASKKKVNLLNDTITQYGVALRWADYRAAHSFHMTADGSYPDIDINSLEKVNITSIRALNVLLSDTEKKAVVITEVNYYRDNSNSIKKLMLKHDWWYDEKAKRWLNAGAFPQFK